MITVLSGTLELEVQQYLSCTKVLIELILTHSETFNKKRKEEEKDFFKMHSVRLRNIVLFVCFAPIYALITKIVNAQSSYLPWHLTTDGYLLGVGNRNNVDIWLLLENLLGFT